MKKENLLEMHALAQAYPHRRPSDFLGIDDPWLAYQVDLATFNAAMMARNGAKGGAAGGKPGARSAKDLAKLAKGGVRKMKIPESGVW